MEIKRYKSQIRIIIYELFIVVIKLGFTSGCAVGFSGSLPVYLFHLFICRGLGRGLSVYL